MSKYLELFAKALDIVNSGKRIERSPYELARIKSILAEESGRTMDSTSKGSSEEEEASTTEQEEEHHLTDEEFKEIEDGGGCVYRM